LRLLWIALVGLSAEVGWLAVGVLSGPLSHSPAFTAGLLDAYPALEATWRGVQAGLGVAWPLRPAVPAGALLGQPALIEPAVALATALLFLALVYVASLLVLSREAGRLGGAVWWVVGFSVVYQLTLLGLPGLFSQDVFSYLAYGHLTAAYGLNPYVWPPSAIAKDPVIGWVAEVWRTYACPYGPLWVDAQSALALGLDRWPIVDQALAYRGLASLLHVVNVALVWRLLGRIGPSRPAERVTALAAFAWNPLLLFELVGNAHNDGLMVSLSLLGVLLLADGGPRVALARRSRWAGLAASVCFTLGALVKYASGIGVIWLALAWAAGARGSLARVGRAAQVLAVSGLVALVVSVVWLELPDSLDPLLNETAGVGYVNALPDQLALGLAGLVGPLEQTAGPARAVERIGSLALLAAYLAWEARRLVRRPDATHVLAATVRSLLVYMLVVSTSVQPWYFALPVALAVLLGLRSALARLTLAYALLALPSLYLSYYLRDLVPGLVWLVYGVGPLLVLLPRLTAVVRRYHRQGDATPTRRLLVRSDVPVGVDHLALDARSDAGPRRSSGLARHESGGAQ